MFSVGLWYTRFSNGTYDSTTFTCTLFLRPIPNSLYQKCRKSAKMQPVPMYMYAKMLKISENLRKCEKSGIIDIYQITKFLAHVCGTSPYLHLQSTPPPPGGGGTKDLHVLLCSLCVGLMLHFNCNLRIMVYEHNNLQLSRCRKYFVWQECMSSLGC